jgi:hypothetical protein
MHSVNKYSLSIETSLRHVSMTVKRLSHAVTPLQLGLCQRHMVTGLASIRALRIMSASAFSMAMSVYLYRSFHRYKKQTANMQSSLLVNDVYFLLCFALFISTVGPLGLVVWTWYNTCYFPRQALSGLDFDNLLNLKYASGHKGCTHSAPALQARLSVQAVGTRNGHRTHGALLRP